MSFELRDSIVRILTPSGETAGAGFLLTKDGLIATCAHVVQACKSLRDGELKPEKVTVILQATGEQREARVESAWWRPCNAEDVAILHIDGDLPVQATPLPLGSSSGTISHPFHTFGFPSMNPEGGIRGEGDILGETWLQGVRVLQLSSRQVTLGFSGAPILDSLRGRVVGMVTSIATPDPYGRLVETAFITPTEILQAVCPVLKLSDKCPYLDLAAFTEDDKEFFFGRTQIIDTLVDSLREKPRFLAVFGPSGSGKSSLVQAGLIPRLREGAVPGSDHWEILLTRPTDNSFQRLLSQWNQRAPKYVAMIIDQFEELFVAYDEATRTKVLTQLTSILQGYPHFTLIIVMRNDFYSSFTQYQVLAQWIQQGVINISSAMTPAEVKNVVQEPALRVGWQFEPGLVETIVNEILETTTKEAKQIETSTILPLLESALTQLWERRQDGMLTHDAYRRIGGVTGGLAQRADQAFYSLEERLQPLVRHLFTKLIHLGDEDQHIPDTRRRRELASLPRTEAEKADIYQVVQHFVTARLLVMNRDSESNKETVEIIHDALLQVWGRLKGWIDDDRLFLVWHQKLEERIREWEGTNVEHTVKHNAHKLLRGGDLKEAKQWLIKRKADLSLQEQDFIKASSMRRIWFAMSMIVIFFMLVSTTGIAAWLYSRQPPSPTRVTTLEDNVDGSLRYCIKNAHSGSTITFAQGTRGTIKLTGGDLVVEGGKRLTIDGPGADQLTISNSNSNAVIHVAKEATLTVSDLSFKNSETVSTGTAFLFNEGTLTVTNSVISDNKTLTGSGSSLGAGIENMGALTVTNSIISNNSAESQKSHSLGGGIFNGGILTVTNSIFSNNSASGLQDAPRGGAIFNDSNGGILTVINSTFSNNSTHSGDYGVGGGGGIFNENKLVVISSTFSNNSAKGNYDLGGGIATLEQFTKPYHMGTFVVVNSTFSNNSASGSNSFGGGIGIYYTDAGKGYSAILRFCTIYGNISSTDGGGIWVGPTRDSHLTIGSSIVAANSARDGTDISGALISEGYNLIENVAGAKGLDARTDRQVNLADLKMDPTLGNNGGPTQILALLPGSWAIDAVPGEACRITFTDVSGRTVTITTDQRGKSRPDGSENACDTGAFESSY